jgi:hypothetical protein
MLASVLFRQGEPLRMEELDIDSERWQPESSVVA